MPHLAKQDSVLDACWKNSCFDHWYSNGQPVNLGCCAISPFFECQVAVIRCRLSQLQVSQSPALTFLPDFIELIATTEQTTSLLFPLELLPHFCLKNSALAVLFPGQLHYWLFLTVSMSVLHITCSFLQTFFHILVSVMAANSSTWSVTTWLSYRTPYLDYLWVFFIFDQLQTKQMHFWVFFFTVFLLNSFRWVFVWLFTRVICVFCVIGWVVAGGLRTRADLDWLSAWIDGRARWTDGRWWILCWRIARSR